MEINGILQKNKKKSLSTNEKAEKETSGIKRNRRRLKKKKGDAIQKGKVLGYDVGKKREEKNKKKGSKRI